jgi:hypothetical protein
MTEIPTRLQDAVTVVLRSDDAEEFEGALDDFQSALPRQVNKREEITKYLIEELEIATSTKNRCSFVAMLSEINTPDAVEAVTSCLDSEKEESDRVQYRAAISLWRMNPPDLDSRLGDKVDNDALSSRVQAVLLRALSQHCQEESEQDCPGESEKQWYYFKKLLKMAKDGSGDNSWAVLRAFRKQADTIPPPSPELERRLVNEFVAPRLRDEGEWRDVRIEAASVLGDVEHEGKDAIQALTYVYSNKDEKPPDDLRRACVESIGRLGTRLKLRDEVKTAMLSAMEDVVPDIRIRAIEDLRRVLGPKASIEVVVEALLERDDQPEGYIDALRRIDNDSASRLLSESLWHPDPDKQRRASEVLTKLGGAEALRTLLAQNRQFVDKYTELLSDADERIMKRHDQLMGHARFSFHISMLMHIIVFFLGVGILITTIAVAVKGGELDPIIALVGTGGGILGILLGLFYRTPFDNIRRSMANLVKINITFLGFIRQINQIDATFKQFYLNTAGFDLDQMKGTVKQIQLAVDKSLERVQRFIDLPSIEAAEQGQD